jgi:hypothetical protein
MSLAGEILEKWVVHYWNSKPKHPGLACDINFGITAGRGKGSARDYTEDKGKVTCKRCLNRILQWDEIEKRRANK